jgi:RNA polymerase sigma factor (sigma-70 family)
MAVAAIVESEVNLRHAKGRVPSLARAAGLGSEESYEAFFDRLLSRAISVGRRIGGSTEEGEDAAVEALARAHLHWDELRTAEYRDAWVLRVAANVSYDQLRRRIRRERHEGEAPRGREATEVVDLRQSLVPLLRRLSRRQRQVVILSHMVGLSHEEIATLLGCSIGSVKVHARRGLERLRSERGSLEALAREDS